jgi:hypothetical protein
MLPCLLRGVNSKHAKIPGVWSTDTPWLMHQLCSRRSSTSQNWICIWSTIYMFLKQSPVEIQAPNMLKLHSMTTYCLCYCLEVLFCHLCLSWLSFPQGKEFIIHFKKSYFNFCCLFMIISVWNCITSNSVTWNFVSLGPSTHWWLEREVFQNQKLLIIIWGHMWHQRLRKLAVEVASYIEYRTLLREFAGCSLHR